MNISKLSTSLQQAILSGQSSVEADKDGQLYGCCGQPLFDDEVYRCSTCGESTI